jgi:transposase
MAARKQYTREFKHEAVRLVTEQGVSVAQAARDLGLRENLLSRWKKELTQQGEQAFPGPGRAQEDELAQLRRENEVLRREREILDIVLLRIRQEARAVAGAS